MNEPNANLETTSWETAWRAVHALLPAAAHMTPASLLFAAERIGKAVDVRDASGLGTEASDCSVLWRLLADAKPDEAIMAITDRSFLSGGAPFVFRISSCESFANAYLQSTGEMVISGADVVLICPESKFLVIYHHEGRVAVIR